MPRQRWNPDFSREYARFRSHVDRDYGERAYGDKLKIETSGMLKDAEPDYEMDIKPYKPEKPEAHPSWESEPQEKTEPSELPADFDFNQLTEPVESAPGEDDMLEIKSENIWDPLEAAPPDAEKKSRDAEPEPGSQ